MRKVWIWLKSRKIVVALSLLTLAVYWVSLPDPLFEDPYSTVLEDNEGNLLTATIAPDGQWRFPQQAFLPEKFEEAILLFEDKRFYSHVGVDPLSMARAMWQNLKAGKIVSGGSTLTMQTIRLARKDQPRTLLEKFVEGVLATRLELRYTKKEILSTYAAHAPFGGNVVGIEAASWRYFGRNLDQLSWAEASLLAVLPNNPSLIHLGKNRSALKAKRDRLLEKLNLAGKLDEVTLQLAKSEELPEAPKPLPHLARHLMTRALKEGRAQTRVKSTIQSPLQVSAEQILNNHFHRLRGNQVFNAAALIVEVESGSVLAYVGNVNSGSQHHDKVDVVSAPRSTGSILKPFLYAAMMDEGKMLPRSLVPDIPTVIAGFSPKNFSHDYDGAVAADKALIRSLNVPAVIELREYRYEKFYEVLKQVGLTTLTNPPDHYGLSLVLGGAEGTLWDITGAYASMSRTLNHYFDSPGSHRYHKSDFHPPAYEINTTFPDSQPEETSWLSASAVWLTFEALKELYRPGEETGWKYFNSSKKIAWKTGTSFGFRDGWAVGVNPRFAVGVWVGNADGEGRPGLTGTDAAAPILFDLFSLLPGQEWFERPTSEMEWIPVCSRSGQRASQRCESPDTTWVSRSGLETEVCQYHKRIHLSQDKKYRVNSECTTVASLVPTNWFVLPPVEEYFYRAKNLSYEPLPPLREDCRNSTSLASMDLLYPKPDASLFIPRDLDGTPGEAVFQVAHRSPMSTVYWHLDGNYIGSTSKIHHLTFAPHEGNHTLTLVDDEGQILSRSFKILAAQ